MKKVFLLMVAVLLMTACATSEERAARQAENMKMLKARQDAHLEFKGETRNYVLKYQPKKETADITFEVDYSGSEYKFHINLDNTGRARVHVIPDGRDYIDYEGTVSAI